MPTEASLEALKNLRDGSLFQWYVIPLFALVVYASYIFRSHTIAGYWR